MRLGAHCVLYGSEIATDTGTVISRLAEAGAEGCELGERFFGVEDREKLAEILERYDIRLAGMHCNGVELLDLFYEPEKSREALEKVAKFVSVLPDKNIIVTGKCCKTEEMDELRERTLAQGAAAKELHDPDKVKQIAQNLNKIVKDIRERYGVTVNYHNHSWEFCDDGLIWKSLADYAPDLMFAMDCGWAAVSGFDPGALLDRYPGRFRYVHLRDYKKSPKKGDKKFKEVHAGFVKLGSGDMDYPALMRHLDKELGEDGWAIVEYELGNFDKNSYLQALSYLKGIRDML